MTNCYDYRREEKPGQNELGTWGHSNGVLRIRTGGVYGTINYRWKAFQIGNLNM